MTSSEIKEEMQRSPAWIKTCAGTPEMRVQFPALAHVSGMTLGELLHLSVSPIAICALLSLNYNIFIL